MTLREYEVETGHWGRTTTVLLSDEDAKARGLIPQAKAEAEPDETGEDSGGAGSGEKEAKAPANKAAPKAPANKDSAEA
ncbi:hypothetical protein BKG74_03475 [Mycobacteroides chelonae]|uniref:hypothetical protein n=1 Tax=Mycobacteroides chelonae TaxID=1774 RepID=UPI0008A9911D|nr:hypothetical protein [Mycobacteroides chelonae]OHU29603.1 hypothetical protein BKG74_03475 [Mycobacteroides chelonae]